jgi:hypothetical protein
MISSGSILSPGDGVGILSIVGNLTMTIGSVYMVDLNGTALAGQYDQAYVTGAVNLGNVTLSLNLGYAPVPGDVFTIINNDGTDAIAGTFNGLAEGSIFSAGGQEFAISYLGGTGNDVVLAAVPESATGIMLLLGGLVLLMRKACRPKVAGIVSRSEYRL